MQSRIALAAALALGLAAPAQADDWFFRAGPTHVAPKSDNGRVAGGAFAVDIGDETQLGLIAGYRLTPNWAIELLAATPFTHEVRLNGAKALDFKHLPPTLSLQYYFAPEAAVSPFLGAGINYTWTYDERETGPLAGTRVDLGNSWGLAAQAGLVFRVGENIEVVAEARWIDIDADVTLNGVDIGSVDVDPLTLGLYLGYRY